jgi:hypothetical protein
MKLYTYIHPPIDMELYNTVLEIVNKGRGKNLFMVEDVHRAIEACNFNKGIGPDGFDG